MSKGIIKIATCQFPVSSNIKRNSKLIQNQIFKAKYLKADIVHFPECALSGYYDFDHNTLDSIDWFVLKQEAKTICKLSKQNKIWIILGSTHPLSQKHLPHNCLYVINSSGEIVTRYDKRFCYTEELEYYAPGDHFSVFDVNNIKCGLLICHEFRYPELYREYKKLGVNIIFQSFYNARQKKRTIHTTIVRASIQTRAANNCFWISASNSSAYYQSWPSIFVRPDGEIVNSLYFHRSGVMINEVNIEKLFYDPSEAFRENAMKGILHSGELVNDPRSNNRKSL